VATPRRTIPETRKRITRICESLPEVEVEEEGRHIGFLVRKKRFAWYLEDHHGDGRLSLNCKVETGANEVLATSSPERYFIPPYLGPRGWIGFWLDVPTLDWREAAELIVDSYRLVAPKRLASLVEERTFELPIDGKDAG
jgi:phosphoribosylglycinamide formyltransferase-1